MDVPYFIKEHLWMNAFDEANTQKKFGESKPSSKLTLKTKWYHSCGCCDNSRSFKQLEKHVTDKYSKEKQTLNPNHLLLQEMYVINTALE